MNSLKVGAIITIFKGLFLFAAWNPGLVRTAFLPLYILNWFDNLHH